MNPQEELARIEAKRKMIEGYSAPGQGPAMPSAPAPQPMPPQAPNPGGQVPPEMLRQLQQMLSAPKPGGPSAPAPAGPGPQVPLGGSNVPPPGVMSPEARTDRQTMAMPGKIEEAMLLRAIEELLRPHDPPLGGSNQPPAGVNSPEAIRDRKKLMGPGR